MSWKRAERTTGGAGGAPAEAAGEVEVLAAAASEAAVCEGPDDECAAGEWSGVHTAGCQPAAERMVRGGEKGRSELPADSTAGLAAVGAPAGASAGSEAGTKAGPESGIVESGQGGSTVGAGDGDATGGGLSGGGNQIRGRESREVELRRR